MSRSKLLGAVFALPLMFAGATSAQANIIALVIDGSGSMNSTEFNLQRTGYVNALTALLVANGQNSIGIWQFSSNVQQELAIMKINTAGDITTVLNALTNMVQLGTNTAIGAAINVATAAITAYESSAACTGVNAGTCGNKIIDVSTDGVNNVLPIPGGVGGPANLAFLAGIKVNCIGIEVPAAVSCAFNDGYGDDFFASTFADFETAVTTKLTNELTPTPEPFTMSLFGAGLLGAAALRRRKSKTA